MGIQPDVSPYGGQTVTGPGWPNVDENALAAAAAQYEALAAKISGTVVPQQQGQLMKLTDTWEGGGSMAAAGEATTIIGGHEANAAQAAAIAAKLRTMEAAVIQTKTMANIVAQETQAECMAIQSMGQLAGLVGQIPQMLGQAMGQVTQAPQQLAQPLGQPLQQLTSMFGQGGGGASGLGAVSPFSAFSNH